MCYVEPELPPPYGTVARTSDSRKEAKNDSQQTSIAADRASSSRTTIGTAVIQQLTSNTRDVLYNHLFKTVSVTSQYDDSGVIKTEKVDLVWNRDRVQCPWCREWFATMDGFRLHKSLAPSGCQSHGECFAHSYHALHAKRYEHDRCFVSGCTSRCRMEEGWDDEVIEKHVKKAHLPSR